MKKVILFFASGLLIVACNNAGKDSVEKADSANKANADTAMNHGNTVVADEASSSFLVRVANSGLAEVQMASMAQSKATRQDIKDFAAMLYHDHSLLNEKVKTLASQRNMTLPATVSDDKQSTISSLDKKSGKAFDKEFIDVMIRDHKEGIDLFKKAVQDSKDTEVKNFADQTVPSLQMHLDSAQAIQKRLK